MTPPPAYGKTDLAAVSLGKTTAEIIGQFAAVPALTPMAEVICGIIERCQYITENRYASAANIGQCAMLTANSNAANQLRDRCHRMGLFLYEKAVAKEKIGTAITAVT